MTTDSPLFNPLFLNIRLTTRRTDKHAFFIEHSTLFLHGILFQEFDSRMAQPSSGLQGRPERHVVSLMSRPRFLDSG